jgi:hypothetical protein
MLPNLTPVQIARFWSKVGPPDANGCRLWLSQQNAYKYGRFLANSRRLLAHRVAYQLTYGSLPSWMLVCHLCDVRNCCEPTHLVAADNAWNVWDRGRKGRTANGSRNGSRTKPERLVRGDTHPARIDSSYLARGDRHPARANPRYLRRGSQRQNATSPRLLFSKHEPASRPAA